MQPLPPPKNRSSTSGIEAHDSRHLERTMASRAIPEHPASGPSAPPSTSTTALPSGQRKRKHRGGKKRKNRRTSFVAPPSEVSTLPGTSERMPTDPLVEAPTTSPPPPFYRRRTGNRSDESIDSTAFLDDHRAQPMLRARRESRLTPGLYGVSQRSGMLTTSAGARSRSDERRRSTRSRDAAENGHDSDYAEDANDRTPLIAAAATAAFHRKSPDHRNYGLFRPASRRSSKSSHNKRSQHPTANSYRDYEQDYHVNNPPSRPQSPPTPHYDDIAASTFLTRSPDSKRNLTRDILIDIDDTNDDAEDLSMPSSPQFRPGVLPRQHTIHLPVEGDVCFPGEVESEMAFEDYEQQQAQVVGDRRRRRRREWPQLWVLDEWSQQEKEQRAEIPGAKKISEPVLIEGRLRPKKHAWHRLDEDAPYRYTYFNEEFESTIHSQTISELVQPGGSFRELFIPDPPLLEDSSESEDEAAAPTEEKATNGILMSPKSQAVRDTASVSGRISSILGDEARSASRAPSVRASAQSSGEQTPAKPRTQTLPKPKRYGPRPTFWLDVMSPTEQEMRVLCKSFGIHALTSEDIMMQEAREKVELFRNYYFINYRTFEQDPNSEDYLEPINMYVCVFRQGIVTFHFSQIPHPANVRRRIRQLTDYLILSSDWISYAIIDDITDVYQPLIHNIEQEVDDIDELILRAYSDTNELSEAISNRIDNEKQSEAGEKEKGPSGIDMLRRVGECRKKVMSLYRLLGNKADVIKGFAKRCNEQWEVAPKSEIGLYLGDIQDHILTMTSNLSHYETLLSRAHSNYLAQVSIRMNERQEQTSDVLGKLTVIGTIVLPMNIICGMWG